MAKKSKAKAKFELGAASRLTAVALPELKNDLRDLIEDLTKSNHTFRKIKMNLAPSTPFYKKTMAVNQNLKELIADVMELLDTVEVENPN